MIAINLTRPGSLPVLSIIATAFLITPSIEAADNNSSYRTRVAPPHKYSGRVAYAPQDTLAIEYLKGGDREIRSNPFNSTQSYSSSAVELGKTRISLPVPGFQPWNKSLNKSS